MTAYTFTLQQTHDAGACASGYRTALAAHGPALDRPLTLADIAKSNGAADALWCLRLLPWDEDIALRRRVLRGVLLPACHRVLRAAVPWYLADLDRWAAGDDAVDLRGVFDAAKAEAAEAAAWAAAWAAAAAAKAAAWAAWAAAAASYAAAWPVAKAAAKAAVWAEAAAA